MTVLMMPGRDFNRAMTDAAAEAKRNTHLIVATSKDTGEARSWQARPRGKALDYRDAMRIVLGDRWTVRVVRVRRRWAR